MSACWTNCSPWSRARERRSERRICDLRGTRNHGFFGFLCLALHCPFFSAYGRLEMVELWQAEPTPVAKCSVQAPSGAVCDIGCSFTIPDQSLIFRARNTLDGRGSRHICTRRMRTSVPCSGFVSRHRGRNTNSPDYIRVFGG